MITKWFSIDLLTIAITYCNDSNCSACSAVGRRVRVSGVERGVRVSGVGRGVRVFVTVDELSADLWVPQRRRN